MPDPDDLTARARIRQAALTQFADVGFQKATIRSIAAEAGVSPGLLRHHFGSKEALRDAVDAYVMDEIRRTNDDVTAASATGTFGASVDREALRPFQRYLARALLDGSSTIATMFDQLAAMTTQWVAAADETRTDRPGTDTHTRGALYTAMVLGIPLLHEHLSRVLGVDILSDDGDRRVALAMLEIYSHPLISTELAEQARAALYPDPPSRSAR
ncbi:TetR/AcrR family transcriptional regulator [Cryptosporangium arvum]|uniref:Transcriptional regulator n=1 Tax=Cryptosporangium arvum DSM 44712 TaxID=927661 RepID=A0A010Z2V6_9ACTN|nr:TetR/AcrR family transcriptional regulator [Cryptosporangium arvum]EXG81743.1 transcriptional regulator [Cryptosporangium arvum DSM 44712]